ncbi:hypothetical protein SCLCIDRAFT_553901 [Scleroderma citrinum Foug A]|uniref:Uncharacterized protein n=1 Tax=Scleroderma citrinum Foug A TaxID=1036808 RepID=A0A0C3D7Z2_9AGAM|nr:hypothetical protein SCLCIDRAFT_553901 [Scleroderma citrinum Foug A]
MALVHRKSRGRRQGSNPRPYREDIQIHLCCCQGPECKSFKTDCDRLRGTHRPREEAHAKMQILTPGQEEVDVDSCELSSSSANPLQPSRLCAHVEDITSRLPSRRGIVSSQSNSDEDNSGSSTITFESLRPSKDLSNTAAPHEVSLVPTTCTPITRATSSQSATSSQPPNILSFSHVMALSKEELWNELQRMYRQNCVLLNHNAPLLNLGLSLTTSRRRNNHAPLSSCGPGS